MRLAEKAIVEVDNIPFFTRSLSLGDRITVVFVQNEVVFDSVVERGGHSTYRVFLEEPDEASKSMLDSLKAMGCDWE